MSSWKLVPETLYLLTPLPPFLIYGDIYLARLMVRIPEMRFGQIYQ